MKENKEILDGKTKTDLQEDEKEDEKYDDGLLVFSELDSDNYYSSTIKSRKIVRKTRFHVINKHIIKLVRFASENLLPLSGSLIKEQAFLFAQSKGIVDFKASNGWLTSLKDRFDMKAYRFSGEAASADSAAADKFVNDVKQIFEKYSPDDIYNLDETGLYYKLLPDKTIKMGNGKIAGVKIEKERITLLFIVSYSGQKLNPLVIGKSQKPHSFKNKNINELNLNYTHQKSSWMTSQIFENFISDWNSVLIYEKRHIVLFMDNFSGHKIKEPSNIKFVFLPSNTTSLIQPLDQGIISNFKILYKKNFLRKLIIHYNETKKLSLKNFKLYDALEIVSNAWLNVKKDTVVNCFNKLAKNYNIEENSCIEEEDVTKLTTHINSFKMNNLVSENMSFQEYLECDNDENIARNEINILMKNLIVHDFNVVENITKENQNDDKNIRKCLKNACDIARKNYPDIVADIIAVIERLEDKLAEK